MLSFVAPAGRSLLCRGLSPPPLYPLLLLLPAPLPFPTSHTAFSTLPPEHSILNLTESTAILAHNEVGRQISLG